MSVHATGFPPDTLGVFTTEDGTELAIMEFGEVEDGIARMRCAPIKVYRAGEWKPGDRCIPLYMVTYPEGARCTMVYHTAKEARAALSAAGSLGDGRACVDRIRSLM